MDALYEASRYEDALVVAEGLLRDLSPAVAARAHLRSAVCELELARPERVAAHIDVARPYFESVGAAAEVVECMWAEFSAGVLKQAADARRLGRLALKACRSLSPPRADLEIGILNSYAAASLNAGDWWAAIDAYEAAIALAEPVFEIRRRARLMNDVAIAYQELGRYDDAIRYIKHAIALIETRGERVVLARSENNLGNFLVTSGRLEEGRPHLERSLALCEEAGLEVGRSHLYLSLSDLNLREGRLDEARHFAELGEAFALRFNEQDSLAEAHVHLGRVAAAGGDHAAADAAFDRGISEATAVGSPEWVIRCHQAYADALETRGDIAGGLAQLKAAYAVRLREVPSSRS